MHLKISQSFFTNKKVAKKQTFSCINQGVFQKEKTQRYPNMNNKKMCYI